MEIRPTLVVGERNISWTPLARCGQHCCHPRDRQTDRQWECAIRSHMHISREDHCCTVNCSQTDKHTNSQAAYL